MMPFHKSFGVDDFRERLVNVLGFGEADATVACEILLESAPLLAAKNVVTLDDAFVSALPPQNVNFNLVANNPFFSHPYLFGGFAAKKCMKKWVCSDFFPRPTPTPPPSFPLPFLFSSDAFAGARGMAGVRGFRRRGNTTSRSLGRRGGWTK
jgi:hypothetical protein